MEKDVKVCYCLYCADFILCFIVTVVGGFLYQYADYNFNKYVAAKMFQINKILNDIHKKMNSMQQNVIDFSEMIKMKLVKIDEDLSF